MKLKLKYRLPDKGFKKTPYKARSNQKKVTYPVTSPGREGYNWKKGFKKDESKT